MTQPTPTRKSIAKLAGVSAQTVSLALRDHPTCNARTRERIQHLAARAGYRPDPLLSKLMLHLRTARSKRLKALICGLTTRPKPAAEPYLQAIIDGAKARAAMLGYLFDVVIVEPAAARVAERLQRVLQARGVQGLLLLPMAESGAFSAFKSWEHYSVVSTTGSVAAPLTHRVVPNGFDNTIRLLPARLARRFGLACNSTFHFLGHKDLAGIDEQPGEIGAAAIDLLAGLIQHGHRGLPEFPRTTLIEGRFHPGRSAAGARG